MSIRARVRFMRAHARIALYVNKNSIFRGNNDTEIFEPKPMTRRLLLLRKKTLVPVSGTYFFYLPHTCVWVQLLNQCDLWSLSTLRRLLYLFFLTPHFNVRHRAKTKARTCLHVFAHVCLLPSCGLFFI